MVYFSLSSNTCNGVIGLERLILAGKAEAGCYIHVVTCHDNSLQCHHGLLDQYPPQGAAFLHCSSLEYQANLTYISNRSPSWHLSISLTPPPTVSTLHSLALNPVSSPSHSTTHYITFQLLALVLSVISLSFFIPLELQALTIGRTH